MSEALRRSVRERAGGRCEYCRLPDWLSPLEPFHLEHITARQHGGTFDLENLAWACHRCNRHKGTNLSGVDPDTKLLFSVPPAAPEMEGTFRVARNPSAGTYRHRPSNGMAASDE